MKAQLKAAVLACPGFEGIAAMEIEELIGAKASAEAAGIVSFSITDMADLCRLCYFSQSAGHVLLVLSAFDVGKTEAATAGSLGKSLKGADLSAWFSKNTTFKVYFEAVAGSDSDPGSDTDPGSLSSPEVEAEVGSEVIKAVKSELGFVPKVDLKAPGITLMVLASGGSGFFGVMVDPFDLGKREYRVFSHSSDIRGNLAYSLLRASGYEPGRYLLDPFTRSGTIAIEAAISSSGFPVNNYRKDVLSSFFARLPPFSKTDFSGFFVTVEKEAAAVAKKRAKSMKPKILASSPSMQYLRSAEKNAKIAGVNKLIRFSRLDIEWLDAKLDEQSVDMIVSYPPQFRSTAGNDKFAAAENEKVRKIYKAFFYHAAFFMKKKGAIALLLKKGSYENAKAAALAYKFKPEIVKSFRLGAEEFELVSFAR